MMQRIAGCALLFLVAACAQREPEICRMTPPEDDSKYDEFLKRKSEAKCSPNASGETRQSQQD